MAGRAGQALAFPPRHLHSRRACWSDACECYVTCTMRPFYRFAQVLHNKLLQLFVTVQLPEPFPVSTCSEAPALQDTSGLITGLPAMQQQIAMSNGWPLLFHTCPSIVDSILPRHLALAWNISNF